ncbi:MAG: LamG domain-containing protein [Spirochaetia bacterium]|nr:LamG domain-containing protein [Spirochaetia bacterium]
MSHPASKKKWQLRSALVSMLILGAGGAFSDEGLVGYWSFDEGEGIVAKDYSGNANHGLVSGGVRWPEGVAGTALEFDGTSTYVDCGAGPSLTRERSRQTIEVWVKVQSLGKNQEIVAQGWFHRLFLSPDGAVTSIEQRQDKKDSTLRESKSSLGDTSVWHHIAVVHEGEGAKENVRIYVDGVRTAVGTYGTPLIMAQNGALKIGMASDNSGRFSGLIDELAIYSRALPESEIKAHYAAKGAWFDKKKVVATAPPDGNVSGPDIDIEALGWKITGLAFGNKLVLNAEKTKNATAANLQMVFPQLGRDFVKRATLDPGVGRVAVGAVLPFGLGNPRNIYQVDIIVGNEGQTVKKTVLLKGIKADALALGKPKLSSEIKKSKIGTAGHLAFGTSPVFSGWSRQDELVELISKAGIKWYRDGVKMETGADGKEHVRPYDLEWVKKLRAKGIEIINEIDLPAKLTPEQFAERCTAVATELKDYVSVFELGNEPNNFGGWIEKYGSPGTWNAKEKDNSTAPWLLEHNKRTDAGAEAIKKVLPKARVIGVGSVTPANLRAINAGLSKALDGIVDHPYTYAMAPERMPYSEKLRDRDGIAAGDKEGNFSGLIEVYQEAFKKSGIERSLWFTEFGFTGFLFNGKTETGLYAGFSEEAQAVYLVRQWLQCLTFPVEAACQYDLMDDYGSERFKDEANFGLVRHDLSPKPAYHAVQRLTSLFSDLSFDPNAGVAVTHAPLHRAMKRELLIGDWDKAPITAVNKVMAFAFSGKNEKALAVWSALPYSGEFNNRVATISLKGFEGYGDAVAVDIITGKTYDVAVKAGENNDLVIENLLLGNTPLLIKFFK